MPFSESITIDRTGTGGTVTSNNPPVASLDNGRVAIYWGDTARTVAADSKDELNTTYKLTMSSDLMALFLPDNVFGAGMTSIRIDPAVFKNGETVIVPVQNISVAGDDVAAGDLLGHLYFTESTHQLTLA